jgi:hypothetical protein
MKRPAQGNVMRGTLVRVSWPVAHSLGFPE